MPCILLRSETFVAREIWQQWLWSHFWHHCLLWKLSIESEISWNVFLQTMKPQLLHWVKVSYFWHRGSVKKSTYIGNLEYNDVKRAGSLWHQHRYHSGYSWIPWNQKVHQVPGKGRLLLASKSCKRTDLVKHCFNFDALNWSSFPDGTLVHIGIQIVPNKQIPTYTAVAAYNWWTTWNVVMMRFLHGNYIQDHRDPTAATKVSIHLGLNLASNI